MIYRKRCWNEIAAEPMCGANPILFFATVFMCLGGLASLGLSARSGGMFVIKTQLNTAKWSYPSLPELDIAYTLNYGWHDVCSEATASYRNKWNNKMVAVEDRKCSQHNASAKFSQVGLPLSPESPRLWRARVAVLLSQCSVLLLALAYLLFSAMVACDCMLTNIAFPHMLAFSAWSCASAFALTASLGVSLGLILNELPVTLSIAMENTAVFFGWAGLAAFIEIFGLFLASVAAFTDSCIDSAVRYPRYASTHEPEVLKSVAQRRMSPSPPRKGRKEIKAKEHPLQAYRPAAIPKRGGHSSSPEPTPDELLASKSWHKNNSSGSATAKRSPEWDRVPANWRPYRDSPQSRIRGRPPAAPEREPLLRRESPTHAQTSTSNAISNSSSNSTAATPTAVRLTPRQAAAEAAVRRSEAESAIRSSTPTLTHATVSSARG